MAASISVADAVGAGDITTVKHLLASGADSNLRSRDGMTPLAVSAFWGYDTIVQLLIEYGADINAANHGTLWTPLHCAAFQGHGKVIMLLMEHGPDLYKIDAQGRTAVDFASALDSIWPFFAAAGCTRTHKSELIKMDIVRKVSPGDPTFPKTELLELSRPATDQGFDDSAINDKQHSNIMSSLMGDVLAGVQDDRQHKNWNTKMNHLSLSVWND